MRQEANGVGHGEHKGAQVWRERPGFVVTHNGKPVRVFTIAQYGTGWEAKAAAEALRDKINAPSAEDIFRAAQNDPGLALEDIAQ